MLRVRRGAQQARNGYRAPPNARQIDKARSCEYNDAVRMPLKFTIMAIRLWRMAADKG